jgi:hypothetical protein
MFARVLSALFAAAGWFARSVLIKFAVFFALFFITTQFIPYLAPLLPGASEIQQAFAAQGAGIWYFLELFHVPTGVSLVVSGLLTRFIIRRIPVIG